MVSARIVSALAASAFFAMAVADDYTIVTNPIPTPTVTKPANALVSIGCFETGVPLENHGPWDFQSPGNCQFICIQENKPVMGLTDGTNCWCGDYIPPESGKTDNSSCETSCSGTKEENCGGDRHWWVVLTGTTRNKVENYDPKKHATTSSTSSATATSAGPQKTSAEETVVVTASSAPQEDDSKSKGPNKAGIAAGVVVGVVVLAAIIAGAIVFLRRKKRRELEEEHRRQTAATSFINGGKLHTSNSSMTDSRLDPEYFANRRSSNGSIADNEDYSRRILKVTNA